MCTVTYIPTTKNNFILTSSRDVPFSREKALFPKMYKEDSTEITYPKDGKAGGTWIGHSDKKRLICLLNGGFENHYLTASPTIKYRKSRGIIVLDLLKCDTISIGLNEINLVQIEPFTLVIIDWNDSLELIEFVWDGRKKHFKKLPHKKHIWSSATLYDAEMRQMRKNWFSTWKLKDIQRDILKFHHHAGNGDPNVSVVLKRENVGTVSITQVSKQADGVSMNYEEIKR